jgi:hypothetical protein
MPNVGEALGMNDTRLNTVAALIDDSRTLLSDMREEGVPADDRIALDRIRSSLNEALKRTRKLKGDLR